MKKFIGIILSVIALTTAANSSFAETQTQKPQTNPVQQPNAAASNPSDAIKSRLFDLTDEQIKQLMAEGKNAKGNYPEILKIFNDFPTLPSISSSFINIHKPEITVITPSALIRLLALDSAAKSKEYTFEQAKEDFDYFAEPTSLVFELVTFGNGSDYLKNAEIMLRQGDVVITPFTEVSTTDVKPKLDPSNNQWRAVWQAKFDLSSIDLSKPATMIYKQNAVESASYIIDFFILK